MKEIGSFIELEFKNNGEYYTGENVLRLNSGRSGIYHSARVLGCETVWIPYYQCETVRNFLLKKGILVKYYHIDESFNPIDIFQGENEAVVIVNYYGIMSEKRIENLAVKYKNVIIDNSQAFFAKPIENCINVYSARKFVGVPDGAYVIGDNVNQVNDYGMDFSSDTADFLFKRIEYGCEGETYSARTKNEERIDSSDILNMSQLTKTILKSCDYDLNVKKRRDNFEKAISLFSNINKLNPLKYYDETCVPMVYPLVVEDDNLLSVLLKNKIFQGHWWKYVMSEVSEECFEYYLSRYIIPITIDQRYGEEDLIYTYHLIKEFLEK